MLLIEIQPLRIQLETLFTSLNTIPPSFTAAHFVLNATTPQLASPVTIAEVSKFYVSEHLWKFERSFHLNGSFFLINNHVLCLLGKLQYLIIY